MPVVMPVPSAEANVGSLLSSLEMSGVLCVLSGRGQLSL